MSDLKVIVNELRRRDEKPILSFILQGRIWCGECKRRGYGACGRCMRQSIRFHTLLAVALFVLGKGRLWSEAMVMQALPTPSIIAGGEIATVVDWAKQQQ